MSPSILDALTVAAIAAAPITELRAAIPVAIHTFGFSPFAAVLISVAGNMIPGIAIIYLLDPFMRFLGRRVPFLHGKVFRRLEKMREKVRPEIDKYGVIGLAIFIGIPLPMTGVWTGAAGSVLLGIPKKKGMLACLLGVTAASLIILSIDLGLVSFLRFLL